MMYYQIIRADGSSKNYKIFSGMLDDFDKQDVVDLYRLESTGLQLDKLEIIRLMWIFHLYMFDDIGIAIHMMVEKTYPLIQEMLSRMLNRRLEVDHESELAFELLRFIRSQLQK
ncbi:hypothetical protein Tco_0472521 [Tanacetum coccineum]